MAGNWCGAAPRWAATTERFVDRDQKLIFISKLGIVEEEADESAFWLELIIDSKLMPASKVERLLQEANELLAIVIASRISASRNKDS